mgnify:CR=1 FL=1
MNSHPLTRTMANVLGCWSLAKCQNQRSELFQHTYFIPDLAPCDFHLCQSLKEPLREVHRKSEDILMLAVHGEYRKLSQSGFQCKSVDRAVNQSLKIQVNLNNRSVTERVSLHLFLFVHSQVGRDKKGITDLLIIKWNPKI